MTVPPAAAQVASITSDGIAQEASSSHGTGPRCTQPSTVLKTPVGLGVVEEAPEEHGHRGRYDDRQVGEQRVEAAGSSHVAHDHRHDQRHRVAEDQGQQREPQRVLDGGGQERVVENRPEVVEPHERRGRDQVGLLDAHDERPDDRPPGEEAEDQEHGQQEHRGPEGAAGLQSNTGEQCGHGSVQRGHRGTGPAGVEEIWPAGPRYGVRLRTEQLLGLVVGVGQQAVDVGALVGQHLLHDRVEDPVDLLGV